jgi:hypothetical protein
MADGVEGRQEGFQMGGKRVVLDLHDGAAEYAERGLFRWLGGVAASGSHHQFQVDVTFLGHTDHGEGPLDSLHHALGQCTAFVQHKIEAKALLLKILDDFRRAVLAADFLIVAKGQVHGTLRFETFRQH